MRRITCALNREPEHGGAVSVSSLSMGVSSELAYQVFREQGVMIGHILIGNIFMKRIWVEEQCNGISSILSLGGFTNKRNHLGWFTRTQISEAGRI